MLLEKVFNIKHFHNLTNSDHVGLVRYFKNTGWLFVSRILSLIISLFISLYVIRYLGPTNYGTLSYAISFTSLFAFIAGFGVDSIVYRELIKNPEKEAEILGSAFLIKLITGIVAVLFCCISALLIGASNIEISLIAIVSIPMILNSMQVIIHAYNAKVQSKYPAIIIVSINIILALCKLLVVYFDKGIIYFALIVLFESILYALFYSFLYQKHFSLLSKWHVKKDMLRILLIGGLPLATSAISITIYSRIDQVMIKHMIDATSVGLYDAAVRLSDVWYLIPNILITSLFPAIINSKKVSQKLFIQRIKLFALLLISINLIIIIPTYFLSHHIVNLLFGEAFAQSAGVLSIYIWSLIGFGLGQLAYTYLLAEDFLYIYLLTSLFSVIVNVSLNLLLIPIYGITGAAISTSVAYSLIPVIPFAFKKIREQLYISN